MDPNVLQLVTVVNFYNAVNFCGVFRGENSTLFLVGNEHKDSLIFFDKNGYKIIKDFIHRRDQHGEIEGDSLTKCFTLNYRKSNSPPYISSHREHILIDTGAVFNYAGTPINLGDADDKFIIESKINSGGRYDFDAYQKQKRRNPSYTNINTYIAQGSMVRVAHLENQQSLHYVYEHPLVSDYNNQQHHLKNEFITTLYDYNKNVILETKCYDFVKLDKYFYTCGDVFGNNYLYNHKVKDFIKLTPNLHYDNGYFFHSDGEKIKIYEIKDF